MSAFLVETVSHGNHSYSIWPYEPELGYWRETLTRVVSTEKVEDTAADFGIAELMRGKGVAISDRSHLYGYGEGAI